MLKKQTEAAMLEFPVSENLHNEKRIPLFDSFKPWLVTMAVVLAIAYIPAFLDATKNPGPGAPRFTPDNPAPISTAQKTDPLKTAVIADKTANVVTAQK
jgi:cytochrome c oxidase subunit I